MSSETEWSSKASIRRITARKGGYNGFLPNNPEALPDRTRGFLVGSSGKVSSPPLFLPLLLGFPMRLWAKDADALTFAVGRMVTLEWKIGAGMDVGEVGRGEPYEDRLLCPYAPEPGPVDRLSPIVL